MCTSSTHCSRQQHQKASLDYAKTHRNSFGQAEEKNQLTAVLALPVCFGEPSFDIGGDAHASAV